MLRLSPCIGKLDYQGLDFSILDDIEMHLPMSSLMIEKDEKCARNRRALARVLKLYNTRDKDITGTLHVNEEHNILCNILDLTCRLVEQPIRIRCLSHRKFFHRCK